GGQSFADSTIDKLSQTTGLSLSGESASQEYDFDNTDAYALAEVVAGYDEQKVSAKGQIKPGKNGKKYRQSSFGANFAEVAVH
ncbi:hypothetical protein R0J93_26685, partial [Pseudoalteromonas sp. SIMBA_148]